jgi:hypothetical protein
MRPAAHSRLFFRHPQIGAGRLQGIDHLLRTDHLRVVVDGVDLAETLESAGHFFDSPQPYQGCPADIVSTDIKCNPGKRRQPIFASSHAEGIGQQHHRGRYDQDIVYGFHVNCSFKTGKLTKCGCPGTDKQIRHQTTGEHGPQQYGPD